MFQLSIRGMLCACAVVLAGCAAPGGPGGSRLVASDDGLSEIVVPASWQTRPNFSANADIRLANAMVDNYLLVNTYLPGDTSDASLDQFSRRLSGLLLKNIGEGKMSTPRSFKIGDHAAIEHELRSTEGDVPLVYLSTAVQGAHARYHLVGWARAGADLSGLRQVMASFRESQTRRPAQERVKIEFDWPARLNAQTSFELKSNKRGENYEVQGDSTMSVRPAGKGELLISSKVTRQKFTPGPGMGDKDPAKAAYLREVIKATLSEIPDFVVNSDGEFVRIENLAAYHRRVQDALIKGLPTRDREAQAKARQMVQSMLTEESLADSMQGEWSHLVENWAGGSYAVGQIYEFTVPYSAPALQPSTFPMVTTQQLSGFAPCHPKAAAKSCVRLVQTSRVSGPGYTQAMNNYVRKTVGPEVTVSQMEVITTVDLLVDPETLLPYASAKKEIKRVTVKAEGKTTTSEDVKESTSSYRY